MNFVLLPQSSIQIQRPQLDVGIFERLNSIVLYKSGIFVIYSWSGAPSLWTDYLKKTLASTK